MSLGTDRVLSLGIENYQVRVTAHCYRPLARVQPEKFGWSGRYQFDKTVRTESTAGDAAGVDQTHAVLNSRPTIWDFREIVAAHFFLFLKTKRAMIGGHNLQVILLQ